LHKLAIEIKQQYGVEVTVITADLSSKEGVNQVLNITNKTPIDVFINNAGLSLGLDSLENTSSEDIDTMIDTNIRGFVHLMRGIVAGMKQQQSGHIINLGSIAGLQGYANGAVYCGSKYAVHGITEALRHECVDYNVKVSEVLPGMVETEFSLVRFHGDATRANNVYTGVQALTAHDIADIICYMATAPQHVNLASVVIYPTAQASPSKVSRKE